MSGHSKWSTIKRQKGAADQKRGQLFTKLARSITLAVIQGKGISDPADNFKLRLAIEKARQANMPRENIERAVDRAKESGLNQVLQEVIYEGFGPAGVAIMVEAATDNRTRSFSEIKNTFERGGGSLAGPGAVSFLFEQKGLLTVPLSGMTPNDIELAVIDFGADDVEEAGDTILVYTKPQELMQVKKKIEEAGFIVYDAELTMKPITVVSVDNHETARKVLLLIDLLEGTSDVQKVYANFEIPDNLITNLTP